jgi:hypothetical protein
MDLTPPPLSSFSPSPPQAVVQSTFETFSPNEIDTNVSFRTLTPAARLTRWLAAAAALVVIGVVIWSSTRSEEPIAPVAVQVVEKPSNPPPVRPEPASTPNPTQPSTPPPVPADTNAPALASAFAAALGASSPNGNETTAAAAGAVSVTVRASPQGATIFAYGQKLGKDVVTVNLEPGAKKTLVVLLDGYQPRKLTVDGSSTNVNIVLRRQEGSAPSAAAAPAGEPATPAAAAPAAAPAPARAPEPQAPAANDPMLDVGAL